MKAQSHQRQVLALIVAVLLPMQLVAAATAVVVLQRGGDEIVFAPIPETTLDEADAIAAAPLAEEPVVDVPPPAAPEPPVEPTPVVEADPGPPPEVEPAAALAPAPPPPPPAQPAPQQAAPPQQAPPPAQPQGASATEQTFASEFPIHAAARQQEGDPASFHWAVIVGVNRYQGRTKNTIGSVSDALVLREALLVRGWRDDHILVLTDEVATHDRIVRAIEWLIRSTDDRSTVLFSFSGHLRHSGGNTALWPTDNRYIWNVDFGRMMGAVRAGRMWVALQGCHAEGLRAPGLEGPGRVITYSSRTHEKSYEDPDVRHSVKGNYMFREALREGWGDADGDGQISAQEAFNWAAPRAHTRTSGYQTPVMSDGLGRPFLLNVGSEVPAR